MLEICGSGLILLAFVALELPVVMMLDCLEGKEANCRYKGSCQQSLDCKLWRYQLLKHCEKPLLANEDFAVCDEWRNCYRAVDYCDGVEDCIDGQDEKHCCPAGTYKCDAVLLEAERCHIYKEKCNELRTCSAGNNVTSCMDCLWGTKNCYFSAKCYSSSHSCDGVNFCLDGSDEKNCSFSSSSALGYVGKWLIIAVIVVAIGCSLGGCVYKKLINSTASPSLSPSPSPTRVPQGEEAVEMPAADPFIFRSSYSYGGIPTEATHTPGHSHAPSHQINDSPMVDEGSQAHLLSNEEECGELSPDRPGQQDAAGQSGEDFEQPSPQLLFPEQPSAPPGAPYPSQPHVTPHNQSPALSDADLPPPYDILFPQREQSNV